MQMALLEPPTTWYRQVLQFGMDAWQLAVLFWPPCCRSCRRLPEGPSLLGAAAVLLATASALLDAAALLLDSTVLPLGATAALLGAAAGSLEASSPLARLRGSVAASSSRPSTVVYRAIRCACSLEGISSKPLAARGS